MYHKNRRIGDIGDKNLGSSGVRQQIDCLRILNPKNQFPCCLWKSWGLNTLPKMLDTDQKQNGMILTTGPTGSGKTATLYAFLKKMLARHPKITIETDGNITCPASHKPKLTRKRYAI